MKINKVAIIGGGNIFPMHAASIRQCGQELVAICDNKEDVAIWRSNETGVKYYTDYKEMLDKEEIDVVHICLPHYLHCPVAVYCMERGKHIMTEKPMAITTADARKMIDCAKKNKVLLACIFQNRYNGGAVLAKGELDSGKLGKIKSAKCSITWDRSDLYYSKSDWKGRWETEGGGVIIDQAIHTLDLMRYLINDEIAYVDATIAKRGHATIEVEDTAEGCIAFKNGVLANFHAINYYTTDSDVEIELQCEFGVINIVSDKGTVRYFNGKTLVEINNPNETFDYGKSKSYWGVCHVKQIADYYDALEHGREPFIAVENAFLSHEMIFAIYDSGKKMERVYF